MRQQWCKIPEHGLEERPRFSAALDSSLHITRIPGAGALGKGEYSMAGAGGSWNLPGGSWNLLGALGTPGRRLGSPRDAPGSSKRRPEGQMAPKRPPQELPKSTIFVIGREIHEKVKIALPSRRQCNFRGSGALEIEFFLRFWGSRISIEKRTRPRWLKIGSLGSLGTPWEGPRAKMGPTRVSQGDPRGAKGAPKSSQNRGLLTSATR